MPSTARGGVAARCKGRGVRDLPCPDPPRDGSVPRLPRCPRRQAHAQARGVRQLSWRSRPAGERDRPCRLRGMPYRARPCAGLEPRAVRGLPRRSRRDDQRDRPRRLRELSSRCRPRARRRPAHVRELPSRRGELRAIRPPVMRELPSAARSATPAPDLCELPRGEDRDHAWPCARLRHVSPAARSERSGRSGPAASVRELPRPASLARSAPRREPRDVQGVPCRARSGAAWRSRDVPYVPPRSRTPRAERTALLELPSVRHRPPLRAARSPGHAVMRRRAICAAPQRVDRGGCDGQEQRYTETSGSQTPGDRRLRAALASSLTRATSRACAARTAVRPGPRPRAAGRATAGASRSRSARPRALDR